MTAPARREEAIRERVAKATPGPWAWFGYTKPCKSVNVYLATINRGRRYVMGFRRWGMSGAQPEFQSDMLMRGIDELADRGEVVVKSHSGEIVGVAHPDMDLIAHAPTDLAYLLSQVEELRAELQRERARVEALSEQLRQVTANRISPFDSTLCTPHPATTEPGR